MGVALWETMGIVQCSAWCWVFSDKFQGDSRVLGCLIGNEWGTLVALWIAGLVDNFVDELFWEFMGNFGVCLIGPYMVSLCYGVTITATNLL